MKILSTKGWRDYELLDSGDGFRLERFGKYTVSRPDPQVIWKKSLSNDTWEKANAKFKNDIWIKKPDFPQKWQLTYKNIKFYAKLTPFKHTGVFSEQVLNWEFMEEKISSAARDINVLNLFGYTGIASLVCANAGAKVTHVDGSKPSISWAKENQILSGMQDKPIRWILDDAISFCAREVRRGSLYEAIVMDPPVYGHGPKGEVWDFDKSLPSLLEICSKLLSKNPLFIVANAYAVSSSSIMLKNLFEDYLPKGNIEYGELALEQANQRELSTGIYARASYA